MTSHSNCLALVLMFKMGGVVVDDYFVPVGLQTLGGGRLSHWYGNQRVQTQPPPREGRNNRKNICFL